LRAINFDDFDELADRARALVGEEIARAEGFLVPAQDRERRQAEAVEQERQRQADAAAAARLKAQQDQERAEAEKRAANKAHLARINRDAAAAIVRAIAGTHSGNEAEALAIAKAVVTAVARGEVPAVSISY
jgi:predicted phage gp36 major capsid-like protein